MLDYKLRPLIDIPLQNIAVKLSRYHIRPNQMTLTGFAIGALAACLLAAQLYALALLCIALNRIADGLDGALARAQAQESDFGGYLDIVLDFIIYSALIFGFALGRPEQALYATFLIFSFIGTGSSFLAYAVIAERKGIQTQKNGKKSFFHVSGLAEGTETIIALCLMCLMPDYFWLIASIFGSMCWITTAARISEAKKHFEV